MAPRTSYVCSLTAEQAARLQQLLTDRDWALDAAPHARWRARREKTTVVAYESGKLVVQGKGTADLVQVVIEPEILGEARFGYEHVLAEIERPEMFEPHAGIDESGKGDYFGPMVIAAVYVEPESARQMAQAGVVDSKAIKSARKIDDLAGKIRSITRGSFSVVAIGPESYNRLYGKFGNVNRMLAWGHARALENLLERVPDCPRALSDQFGSKQTVLRALMERGRRIVLEQETKAERDVAVAAASVLARSEFVRGIDQLGRRVGVGLPKGAGPQVDRVAGQLFAQGGEQLLRAVAKLHFRTTAKARSNRPAGGSAGNGPSAADEVQENLG